VKGKIVLYPGGGLLVRRVHKQNISIELIEANARKKPVKHVRAHDERHPCLNLIRVDEVTESPKLAE
jgi:hypothetical protein